MKRTQFSVEPIVAVLKQAELGLPVADLICQTGISEQTFFRWRKQCAGIDTVQGVQAALGCECAAEEAGGGRKRGQSRSPGLIGPH
jgi:hypothetical protein